MNPRRLALLLVVALAAIGAGWFASTRRNSPREAAAPALLPALANDLNSLTAVTLRKGGANPGVTLHKVGNQWVVAQRADYPADYPKLRKLLLSLRDARIVEEKTSDPARFALLGLEDPVDPVGLGAEVTVATAGGKSGLIVGKSAGEGNFVRRSGENRSYTETPPITLETEPRFWIDTQLIDVPVALIQSLEFQPAAAAEAATGKGKGSGKGGSYTLRRVNPAEARFSLEGVPPGRKPKDEATLAPPASTFTGLNAEDVAPAGDIDFAAGSRVTLTLTDGRILTLTGTVVADKHWIEVKADKDAALDAKAAGRAFEIAGYRYDAIFKPVEQFLEPPPQKPEPAAGKLKPQQQPTPAQSAAPPRTSPLRPGPPVAPQAPPAAPP
jgi:hypothetical protein